MDENFCRRAKEGAILLANQILDEQGGLTGLDEVVLTLEKEGFFHVRDGFSDADIIEHQLRVLKLLQKEGAMRQRLLSFGLPLADPLLLEMIAITLEVDEVSDREVICAVLSALLTPLRQTVGSCFATAPAILVHEEYPFVVLEDFQSLLSTGKLTRVFGGVEYTVPISPSPGIGNLKREELAALENQMLQRFELKKKDLKNLTRLSPKLFQIEQMKKALRKEKYRLVAKTDHLLLKMWEFTIASFADVKTEFSRWNLYSSLGLHPDEKGGIGELIFLFLQAKLEEANQKLTKMQNEYEIAFDQVRATESLMRSISTEAEGRRLKAEHHARLYHLRACEELRDKYNQIAKHTAEFFPFLIEIIMEKFQQFFQEVYDAEMQDMKGSEYDDSPAGFRLLYKHGRAHVASWTYIHTKEEYIQALKDFFFAIEHSLMDRCPWEEGKEMIPPLITAMTHLLTSEEFLITAFLRLAKAHKVPLQKLTLDQLDEMEKKPWAYTSGGTIPTLVKTYFRREGSLSEEAKWIESPLDLLVFILDTLKTLPPWILDPFLKNPKKRMLMTSPTHAFSLFPGLLKEGFEDPGFTYTYVRDQVLYPGQEFYKNMRLNSHEQVLLLQTFAKRLFPLEAHQLQQEFSPSPKSLTPSAFAKMVPHPYFDAFLFEALPLIGAETRYEAHVRLAKEEPLKRDHDVHAEIAKKLPTPPILIFADSNWTTSYFAFAVNPATNQLDLFRTDRHGIRGAPLKEWGPFLNGSAPHPWSIFLRPHEYSF